MQYCPARRPDLYTRAAVAARVATFHYVALRAFAHETEDAERVRQALRHVAGDEKMSIEETVVEGTHKNRIRILEATLKSGAARKLFLALAAHDAAGLERLAREAPARLDENLNFHLRLDKQEAYAGRVTLASSDDAITVRAKVQSFAAKRGADPLAEAASILAGYLERIREGSTT